VRDALLRFGLDPDDERARAAWPALSAELEPALARTPVPDADLLPLVAYRMSALALDDPVMARLGGARRRAWYANEVALRSVRPGAVVIGRAASVLTSAPPGVLSIDRVEQRDDWAGPTTIVEHQGGQVRVPVAADHLLEMLLRRWWVDAAFTARQGGIDWDRFVGEAERRGVRLVIRRRLHELHDLAGEGVASSAVVDRLRPGAWSSLRERAGGLLWRARQIGSRD
jgi:hypothetical protein